MGKLKLNIFMLFLLLGVAVHASDDSPVKVSALVDSNNVGLSEVFKFQIHVQSDSDNIEVPDLSGIKGFKYTYNGASKSTQSSLSIVNGNQEFVAITTYVLSYSFNAINVGSYIIPKLGVSVDGVMYYTEPINIKVTKNTEYNIDSILEYKLPRNTLYLGETVPLELVWYFRNSPQLNNIDVPAFTDDRFIISKASPPTKAKKNERVADVYLNGAKYWAVQSETIIDGVAYTSVRMKWYISPKDVGRIELLPSSIIGSIVVGYRDSSRRSRLPRGISSMFDNDSFFNGREPVVKQFTTSTKPQSIEVLPLPIQGRPADFTGVISPIKLGVEVNADSASVGEPITMDLYVKGVDNIYNMKLPDFNKQQNIKGKFRVTEDSNGGSVVGDMRKFKLTFRALTPNVTAIPPLAISYFDPNSKKYQRAKTWDIPISVKAAKIVTATDIESNEPLNIIKNTVEENHDGILANVTDDSVLVNLNIPVWKYLSENKVFFSVFPACYFSLILGQLVLKRRGKGANKRASNRAIKDFKASLNSTATQDVSAQDLTDSIITYFRVKLQLGDREFTLNDFIPELEKVGCSVEVIDNYTKVARYCEACCYAGQQKQVVSKSFVDTTSTVMIMIDEEINVK